VQIPGFLPLRVLIGLRVEQPNQRGLACDIAISVCTRGLQKVPL